MHLADGQEHLRRHVPPRSGASLGSRPALRLPDVLLHLTRAARILQAEAAQARLPMGGQKCPTGSWSKQI